jgi:hypothetical protein
MFAKGYLDVVNHIVDWKDDSSDDLEGKFCGLHGVSEGMHEE